MTGAEQKQERPVHCDGEVAFEGPGEVKFSGGRVAECYLMLALCYPVEVRGPLRALWVLLCDPW